MITIYRCDYCDKEFASIDECMNHEASHAVTVDAFHIGRGESRHCKCSILEELTSYLLTFTLEYEGTTRSFAYRLSKSDIRIEAIPAEEQKDSGQ